MAKKVKVLSVGAIVNGNAIGSEFEMDSIHAEKLVDKGYVKIIGNVVEKKPAKEAPKKAATKAKPKAAPKKESKDK